MAMPDVSEQHNNDIGKPRFGRAYSFALVTGLFFLLSWVGQFVAQLVQVRNEAQQHGETFAWSDFWPEFLASTFENWQSEFLQLVWQAVGLALLLFWGSRSPRSLTSASRPSWTRSSPSGASIPTM